MRAIRGVNLDGKIVWMLDYCKRNGAQLSLQGECGFWRPCVGILVNGLYPDYEWWDKDYSNQLDKNGEVWKPRSAYHKHPCVAVLGHDEDSINQLWLWLQWFEDNGFKIEVGGIDIEPKHALFHGLMGTDKFARMVRGSSELSQ